MIPQDALQLTAIEATTLDDLEVVIEKGLAGFIEVGQALQRICDGKLYRETHGTFEEYCKVRWGFSRRTGYDLMQTAEVATTVQDLAQTPVSREVARALLPLKDEPEKMQKAVEEAVEQHGPKPTAKQLVVDRAPRAEDHGDGHHEQVGPPSQARIDRALATYLWLENIGVACEAMTGQRAADLEHLPNFDRDEFVRALRAHRRDLGRLIRRIDEHREP